MKGRPIEYLPEEIAWIEEHKDLPRAEAHRRFVLIFDRADVSKVTYASLCKRKGWRTGRDGRFAKGQAAHNKGKPMPYSEKSAQTRFRKGQPAHNAKHFGHERVTYDGYVEISVPETNPHTGYSRRYVQKHRWLWEKANGPVPEGHALKCLDGNRQNTDPANWVAIPRGMLPRLNSRFGRDYDAAPADLKPTILAVTRLEHQAREKRKGRTE